MTKGIVIIFQLLWFYSSYGQTTTWTDKLFCRSYSVIANDYFIEGVKFLKNNEPDRAVVSFSNSILADSLFCDAYDNLAIALRMKGDYNGALRNYLKSFNINRENYIACTNMGEIALLAGWYELAFKSFSVAVNRDSMNPEGYFGQTKCYLAINDFDNALISLEIAKEKYRISNGVVGKDVLYLEGMIYFRKDDIPTSKRLLEEIYDSFSEDPSMNLFLGYCYIDSSFYDKSQARKYFKKAEKGGIKVQKETWDKLK